MSTPTRSAQLSRRRVLKTLGVGAIGAGAAVSGWVFWPTPPLDRLPLDPAIAQRGLDPIDPARWPPISLEIIHTASINVPEGLVVADGDWRRPFAITVPAVLIQHPQATLLFDAGLGTQFPQRASGSLIGRAGGVATLDPTVTQLAARGIDAEEIDLIVLSHAHADHTDGISDFPHAELVLSAEERGFAAQQPATNPIAVELVNPQRRWRLIEFGPRPVGAFDRSYDLLGDGSLVLVPLPGHTPGHMGLLATIGSDHRYFFTGDATWSLRGLTIPAEKSRPLRTLVDEDRAATRDTIAQIHAWLSARPDIVPIAAHDRAAQAALL